MQLSQRAQTVQESPIRKLKPYADECARQGVHIYHLNIGQPDIPTPEPMLNIYRNLDMKVIPYGPSQGLDEYRSTLSGYYWRYGIDLPQNRIIVTNAGSEAIVFALLCTCNEGDEVIIPEPFYTNYNGFARQTGVKIVPLTTYAEDGFALPKRDAFEALITDKTRAIMICNPGNPTGAVYTREDIEMLADIVRDRGLFLIADEVYREFTYDGRKHVSIMEMEGLEEHAVMVDSISKRFSACGYRIGCIASRNDKLMAAALKFAQARLCPPTVEQLSAMAAAELGDDYFEQVLREYDQRRNIVFDALQEIDDIVCVKPGGAFYIIAKLPVGNAEHFTIWMLEHFRIDNETVMVAPAEGFYATPGMGRDEVRLAYILNQDNLKKAMRIFREGLNEYRKKHA